MLGTSIVLSAVGQLCMKLGMQKLHLAVIPSSMDPESWLFPSALWTVAGLVAYALSLLCWLVVLTRYPLSYAHPFLGLSYVIVYIGATEWDALAEPATPLRFIGTLLVIAGVAVVSRSGAQDAN